MHLIQTKLRGTGPLIESNWFELSPGLNQFHFLDQGRGSTFLRALQTLNPLVSCKKTNPFRELPHYEKRGTHTRHIQPAKRTIALGVFGATAQLVHELGLLDQNLYETDRIEIGRRLDYSRWINFVELSSSTRWKEAETGARELLLSLQQLDSDRYRNLITRINDLKGPERIKDELAQDLLTLLDFVEKTPDNIMLFEKVVRLIKRAAHFQTARKVVLQRLPFFIYFNSMGEIAPPVSKEQPHVASDHQKLFALIEQTGLDSSFSGIKDSQQKRSVLEKIDSGIRLSLHVSRELQRMDPIFLFDTPEVNLTPAKHKKLRNLIQETSQSQQCLYLSSTQDFFQQAETGRSYSCSQLEITGK